MTAWEPSNHIAQRIVDGPSFEHVFDLQSKNNGTEFAVTGKMEVKGILKLMAGMVVKQSEKMLEAELSTLKILLEKN